MFRNHVKIEISFDFTKREFIGMGRVFTTAESCSPPTPIPPRMLTKFWQSETAPQIFPTQCQAPSTWLSNSGVQIFFQVCRVKLKENVISANHELSQTPTMGLQPVTMS